MTDTRTVEAKEGVARIPERRRRNRVLISTPVRIRALANTGRNSQEATTTVNLSADGILIETENQSYYRGKKLAVVLPYHESSGDEEPEQEGIVVRVSQLGNRRRSVAISLGPLLVKEKNPVDTEILEQQTRSSSAPQVPLLSSGETMLPLVLVQAEESAARASVKAHLSGEGYSVITVGSAGEARTVLSESTPALVIAEIEGEGMPGYDICTHCKETPRLKTVPVLLLTNSAYPSDYAKAHSLGAMVCMAKPYKRERLGHVVRLLAPPPNANDDAAPRRADASRRMAPIERKPAPAKSSKFSLLKKKHR